MVVLLCLIVCISIEEYALHGSFTVPGHRDSHGCIRLFTEDAKWLNKEFIDLPKKGQKGTLVIIDKHKV